MAVFKTFWRIVLVNLGTVITYMSLLIVFAVINSSANAPAAVDFEDSRPKILIQDEDDSVLSRNLTDFMKKKCDIVEVDEKDIEESLFYRDIDFTLKIPQNYGSDLMAGKNPEIETRTVSSYPAALAENMLSRYGQTQNIYSRIETNEEKVAEKTNAALEKEVSVEISSNLDGKKLEYATGYLNFVSYSGMALIIFVICTVVASFKKQTINRRTLIGAMSYQKHNFQILLSSTVYTLLVWILTMIMCGIVVGFDFVMSPRGLLYGLNVFCFTFCSLTIALLICSLTTNKGAINGIVNVVALGSAFICGGFVPIEYMPKSIETIAHVLPTYWYTNTNNYFKTMENLDFENLKPALMSMAILLAFSVGFIILNNVVTRAKRKS